MTNGGRSCSLCDSKEHLTFQCSAFKELSSSEKRKRVKGLRLCFNCLSAGHKSESCQSRHSCRTCGQRHHTLIHLSESKETNREMDPINQTPSSLVATNISDEQHALFITCQVLVEGPGGKVKARALIDPGSAISLATNRLAATVKAEKIKRTTNMTGLQSSALPGSKYTVSLKLSSVYDSSKTVPLKAALLEGITAELPAAEISGVKELPCFQGLQLADSAFDKPGRVDLLLGLDVYSRIHLPGRILDSDNHLCASQSIFGWTIGGTVNSPSSPAIHLVYNTRTTISDLGDGVRRFWELEEPPQVSRFTSEEQQAIDNFNSTHSRDSDGRYTVSLPRKVPAIKLGSSGDQAVRHLLQTERVLKCKGSWNQFRLAVKEYFVMDHAEVVPETDLTRPKGDCYYLPMHGVVKESSSTTKLRIVFDVSALTTSGNSLNDSRIPGPCMYPAIPDLLIKFRTHKVAMTADIGKMFREVGLQEADRDLHRFVWRPEEGAPIQITRMKRLTFGVASSPFLATQILRQLAKDHYDDFPRASNILSNSFYVDDCLTGAETVEEAISLQHELYQLLMKAQMTLRMWRSSSAEVLKHIPGTLKEVEPDKDLFTPKGHPKALGVHWVASLDVLHVSIPSFGAGQTTLTKRSIASAVARIYDVLGWHAPAVLIV